MSSTPIASKIIPKASRVKVDPAQIQYTSDKQKNAVQALIDEFTVSPELLKDIKNNFMEGMRKGLKKDGETMAMITSYVMGRLDGSGMEPNFSSGEDKKGHHINVGRRSVMIGPLYLFPHTSSFSDDLHEQRSVSVCFFFTFFLLSRC